MRVARGRRNARPVPWGAEELAARQAVTALVNANPWLWPALNRLTLATQHTDGTITSIDWCATRRALERHIKPNRS